MANEGEVDLEQMLGKVSLFEGLDKKDLRRLSRAMKVVKYPQDHTIIEEGSGGYGGMGVIISGSCKVLRGGAVINHIRPGQVFGEMSLIDDRPRSATVVAEEPTEAAEISAWEFRARIKENPEIAINLLKAMSQRLRDPVP